MDEQWIEHLTAEYSPALLKYLIYHVSSREDAGFTGEDVFS